MKKENRIRKNEEFSKIIGLKKSASSACFVVYYTDKTNAQTRVGISVSKKLGDAVDRNRIKRQVREMVKELTDFDTCKKDFIVIVRNGFLSNSFQANKLDLEKVLKKAIIIGYE